MDRWNPVLGFSAKALFCMLLAIALFLPALGCDCGDSDDDDEDDDDSISVPGTGDEPDTGCAFDGEWCGC